MKVEKLDSKIKYPKCAECGDTHNYEKGEKRKQNFKLLTIGKKKIVICDNCRSELIGKLEDWLY